MNLLSYILRKEADALAARLPHISARREKGAKAEAQRKIIALRTAELELERKATRRRA